ncbi:unnamed protein product [Candidatus Paraburkholderia kirkii UZHbot1]|uniref:WGS project CAFE00000000 data, contig bkir_c174 n=1 Tax=Candidatus Paraburkholderia kirkii UZHbot1 TaxID=1055526 RepID=U3UAM5_9BURK|nr:unnamed protein product [Candidatus Paraburkholderia kirkii UZHbot1]
MPDRSIGLEMQFYAVFPLLMLLIVRYGALAASRSRPACAHRDGRHSLHLFSAESIRFVALALPAVRILRRVLGIPFGKVMGDLAYSFYLIHLLVLLPVAGFLTKFERYVNAPRSVRFAVVAVIVGTITFALSWLLYRTVEKPGIALGKRLLKRRIVMNRTEAAI